MVPPRRLLLLWFCLLLCLGSVRPEAVVREDGGLGKSQVRSWMIKDWKKNRILYLASVSRKEMKLVNILIRKGKFPAGRFAHWEPRNRRMEVWQQQKTRRSMGLDVLQLGNNVWSVFFVFFSGEKQLPVLEAWRLSLSYCSSERTH